MKTWKIPMSWTVTGIAEIEANTLEEAIEIARTDDSFPLPEENASYLEGSCEVEPHDIEFIRTYYNKDQTDDLESPLRYYICGLGYDKNDCVTDYEMDFGNFDTYEETYALFTELQSRSIESFFKDTPEVYQLLIQVEECVEEDGYIECVDVKVEWWVTNPNYKEV
jgi:hypothetical protein